jgi:hypothetical protein
MSQQVGVLHTDFKYTKIWMARDVELVRYLLWLFLEGSIHR